MLFLTLRDIGNQKKKKKRMGRPVRVIVHDEFDVFNEIQFFSTQDAFLPAAAKFIVCSVVIYVAM